MRSARKMAAVLLVGTAFLAQAPTATALSCSPMNASTANTKLRGVWKWSTQDLALFTCTFHINSVGLTIGGINQCSDGAGATGTLTGNVVVNAKCKVSGTLTLNVPNLNLTRVYTLDAALHQSANTSGSIIMGSSAFTGRSINFWMIQTTGI